MKKITKAIAFLTVAMMLFTAIPASAATSDNEEKTAAQGSGFTLQSYESLGLRGLNSITKEDLVQYAQSVFSASGENTANFYAVNGSSGEGGMTEAFAIEASERSQYSSVTEGYICPPGDQGWSMDCWLFAAVSSAEASYAVNTGEKERFSVAQAATLLDGYKYDVLGNSTGDRNIHDRQGGNPIFYMLSAAAWNGIESDALLPYSTVAYGYDERIEPSLLYGNDIAHLENGTYLPYMNEEEVLSLYKLFVVSDGAVTCDYHHDDRYFNWVTSAYYSDKAGTFCNHEVAIVGWNDNYPAENFNKAHRPPKDGAWLAKNSWGTDWGTDGDSDPQGRNSEGYFWISYYDTGIETITCFDYNSADRYKYNYQYDGGFGVKTATIAPNASVCTAYTVKGLTSDKERIDAVGFFVDSSDVTGKVSVYTDGGGQIPKGKTLLAQADFEVVFPGYYTVEIPNGPVLGAGEHFMVSLQFDRSADIMIDVESEEYNVTCRPDTTGERTALRTSSGIVKKLAGTPRIKVFTNDAGGVPTGNRTVTFDANGGTCTPVSQIKPKNQSLRLQYTQPIRDGGKFLGWSRDKNAETPEFKGGDYYTEDKDVTLYAVWELEYPTGDEITVSPSSVTLVTEGDAANVTVKYSERFSDIDVYVANVSPEYSGGKVVYYTDGLRVEMTGNDSFSIKAESFTQRNIKLKLSDRNYPLCEFELDVTVQMLGDINQDEKLNTVDSLMMVKLIMGTVSTEGRMSLADINRDGKINSVDSVLLKRRILGSK